MSLGGGTTFSGSRNNCTLRVGINVNGEYLDTDRSKNVSNLGFVRFNRINDNNHLL